MAKAKITPFAQVLRLLETLTDGEKATLRDVLRPAPAPRKTKQASKKPKAANAQPSLMSVASAAPDPSGDEEPQDKEPICVACGHEESFQDHFPPSPHYHAFDAGKKRAKSA